MHVDGLWRYPVKSLAGETLPSVAKLTTDGLAGDRLVHVRDGTGPLTGRTRSGLLTLPATTGTDGIPLVDGHRWDTPTALALVRDRAGAGASLTAYDGPERFDITKLLVATDGAVAHFGHDVRRLRPNLLLGGVGPAEEATWPGRALRIGSALVGIYSARQRCIVTSIDPDSGAQDLDVCRRIRQEFANRLALNCTIRVGDPGRDRRHPAPLRRVDRRRSLRRGLTNRPPAHEPQRLPHRQARARTSTEPGYAVHLAEPAQTSTATNAASRGRRGSPDAPPGSGVGDRSQRFVVPRTRSGALITWWFHHAARRLSPSPLG